MSEIMLQQTQVSRVLPKYLQFLERFPTVQDLAQASLSTVLVTWQGLGYNRRAKFLWQAAGTVVGEMGDIFPRTPCELMALSGIGCNTAGAIIVYAYNQPAVFIETNIRTVFIHHFFRDQTGVPDKAVQDLVADSLPDPGERTYRDWYWALMDYGTHLKQTVGNKSRASKSYVLQSPFQGSRRQVRGAVIRQLGLGSAGLDELASKIDDSRLSDVLQDLAREGMVCDEAGRYRLV